MRTFDYSVIIQALFRAEIRGRTAAFRSAMSHLISKALPQRCQIRNLKEIVHQYCEQFDKFSEIIDSIVFFGMTHDVLSNDTLREHVRSRVSRGLKPCDNAKQFVTFTYLKFFVYKCIDAIPPLHRHMMNVCDWFKFSRSVDRDVLRLNMRFYEHLITGRPSTDVVMQIQNLRNTMVPTLSHAMHHITQWNAKRMRKRGAARDKRDKHDKRQQHKRRAATHTPSHAFHIPKHMSRIVATPAIDDLCGAVKRVITMFCNGANKKSLYGSLGRLTPTELSFLAEVIARTELRNSIVVREHDGTPTNIDAYICFHCVSIKNSRQPYTSLSRVIYDYHTQDIFCGQCLQTHKTPLEPIQMSIGTVIYSAKKTIHFICERCGFLSSSLSERSPSVCSECSARNPR